MTVAAPDYLRQQGFFDPAKAEHASVTFVGVGGIGSFASFAVAKLGVPNITLVDPDIVEVHNLPSQMYSPNYADAHKAWAMADQINQVVGSEVAQPIESYLADMPRPMDLVVSGLDSMAARVELWEQHVRMNPYVPLLIDGRIDGQTIVLYTVRPTNSEDVRKYEATLALSDDEVPSGLCTERAIIDVGFMLGSQIARMVRLWFTDQRDLIPRIMVIDQKNMRINQGDWLPDGLE